jgi:dipeptidyl aminopeptidase/acylaminoacyl peptidase
MKAPIAGLIILNLTFYLAAGNRALRFEDMFSAGRLSAPVVSPDGKWIAFGVRTPEIEGNRFSHSLYLTDRTGRILKKVAATALDPVQPRFRDPAQLTFISTWDGDPQLSVLNLNHPTAPAVRLTRIPGGIGDYLWSPDGKRITFQKEVFPESGSLRESVRLEKEKSDSKVQAKVLTSLLFRVWNQWKDGKRNHVFLHTPGTEEFQDLTPGDFDTPPVDLGGSQDFRFSPDGKLFAYVKNPDPMVAISTNNDIFIKDLSTGQEKNITSSNPGNDMNPVFSPKGQSLAYLSMRRARFEADKKEIVLYDLKPGSRRYLTSGFANTISEFIFSPDGKYIYFLASESVYQPVFRLTLENGKIEKLADGINASSLTLFPDGKTLIFLNQSVKRPNEIFRLNLKERTLVPITDINRDVFRDVEMNPIETFVFRGAKNEAVEGILVKPPFFDPGKKYPLVLLVHGGPQGGWTDDFHFRWNLSMFASPGYVVAAINFHGSNGYGQEFTDAVSGDWGGAPHVDMVKGQQYLVDNFPYLDRERIVAAGASYGGFLVNWMAGNADDFKYPFRCFISHDGTFDSRSMYYSTEELWFEEWEYGGTPWNSDLYEKWNPARFVDRFRVPMLIIHSERDYRVPVSQGLMLFTALQRLGVKSKMLYFPDEDHFVTKPLNARLWWKTVFDWIAENIH